MEGPGRWRATRDYWRRRNSARWRPFPARSSCTVFHSRRRRSCGWRSCQCHCAQPTAVCRINRARWRRSRPPGQEYWKQRFRPARRTPDSVDKWVSPSFARGLIRLVQAAVGSLWGCGRRFLKRFKVFSNVTTRPITEDETNYTYLFHLAPARVADSGQSRV